MRGWVPASSSGNATSWSLLVPGAARTSARGGTRGQDGWAAAPRPTAASRRRNSGGTTALQAAGAVHSDIEKGFIRAEVIPWDALLTHGSLHDAKEAGAIRLEGKEYAVKDGDVIYFRFAQ